MKYSVALLLPLILLLSGPASMASAKTLSSGSFDLDGSLSFATGPGSYDAGFGFNVGAGTMLDGIHKNLQARIDWSFYRFQYDYWQGGGSTRFTYTRMPITVSGRFYVPVNDKLRAYAQAGVETSVDHYDYYANGGKRSKNEVNIGLSPGGGIEFFVNKNLSIFALGRVHLISDSYVSMQFGVAGYF